MDALRPGSASVTVDKGLSISLCCSLPVACSAMYAGKTSYLLESVICHQRAGLRVLIIKVRALPSLWCQLRPTERQGGSPGRVGGCSRDAGGRAPRTARSI